MRLLDWTVGYGYKPFRVIWWMVGIFVLGCITFRFGGGYMRRAQVSAADSVSVSAKAEKSASSPAEVSYPPFCPFLYSLDVFVPLLQLHQTKYWLPGSWLLWSYFALHSLAGWVLTALFLAALTGLLRK